MEAIKLKWLLLQEKTADLSVRERAILLATLVAVIVFAWLQFVVSPMQAKTKSSGQQLLQSNQEISDYSLQFENLLIQLEKNPNEPLREEQAELKERLDTLASEIESQLSNLMAPQKMAEVMQSVLADYQGLKLLRARNLPVKPLKLNSGNDAPASNSKSDSDRSETEAAAVIFAHGFEMELEGNYFQTLQFLQRLEEIEGFYWQALDYRVENHPKAKITLQLNTLSLQEEWIGV